MGKSQPRKIVTLNRPDRRFRERTEDDPQSQPRHTPTPEEIAEKLKELQATWDEKEHYRRARYQVDHHDTVCDDDGGYVPRVEVSRSGIGYRRRGVGEQGD